MPIIQIKFFISYPITEALKLTNKSGLKPGILHTIVYMYKCIHEKKKKLSHFNLILISDL